MPSGKPGKFSTSLVVISWPPRTPPAETPSKTTGFRLALAAYIAAVYPAGPEPTMTTFSSPAPSTFPRVTWLSLHTCRSTVPWASIARYTMLKSLKYAPLFLRAGGKRAGQHAPPQRRHSSAAGADCEICRVWCLPSLPLDPVPFLDDFVHTERRHMRARAPGWGTRRCCCRTTTCRLDSAKRCLEPANETELLIEERTCGDMSRRDRAHMQLSTGPPSASSSSRATQHTSAKLEKHAVPRCLASHGSCTGCICRSCSHRLSARCGRPRPPSSMLGISDLYPSRATRAAASCAIPRKKRALASLLACWSGEIGSCLNGSR
jgi:hypothetical protein